MKKAIVFLANGFEEMEALGTVDILRRGGIEVTTVSITTDTVVMGAHNIPVTGRHDIGQSLPWGQSNELLNEHLSLD